MGNLDGFPGSWLWFGPGPAVGTIFGSKPMHGSTLTLYFSVLPSQSLFVPVTLHGWDNWALWELLPQVWGPWLHRTSFSLLWLQFMTLKKIISMLHSQQSGILCRFVIRIKLQGFNTMLVYLGLPLPIWNEFVFEFGQTMVLCWSCGCEWWCLCCLVPRVHGTLQSRFFESSLQNMRERAALMGKERTIAEMLTVLWIAQNSGLKKDITSL